MADQELDEQQQVHQEHEAFSAGTHSAAQMAAQEEEQVYKNHKFLAQLRDSGLDRDFKADLGPLLAGAHVTGVHQDPEAYEQHIKWINENEGERDLIRNDPGQHIKQRPLAMAVVQDLHLRPDKNIDEWVPPMDSAEREDHRRAMRAVTNFQSLGSGDGLETVGTVQTSTEISRTKDEETSLREKAGKWYK
jgi:hypothetical protein